MVKNVVELVEVMHFIYYETVFDKDGFLNSDLKRKLYSYVISDSVFMLNNGFLFSYS